MTSINPGAGAGMSNHSQAKSIQAPKQADNAAQEFSLAKPVGTPAGLEAQKSQQAQAAQQIAGAEQAAQQEETRPLKKEARQLSKADIIAKMIDQGISNTASNRQIAQFMMKYGVEVSSSKFEQITQLLKGKTDEGALNATMLAVSKGLGQDNTVDFLSQFLSQHKLKQTEIQKFQEALSTFKEQLSSGRLFPESISSRVAAIIAEFEKELKKLAKRFEEGQGIKALRRGGLIKDLYAARQLLTGLQKKHRKDLSKAQHKDLAAFKKASYDFIGALSSQLILSKNPEQQPVGLSESYAYWQIPNLMAENPLASNMDILIKKDPMRKKLSIDPNRTKVLLKFDTPKLGEMAVELTIMDKKVWATFNSDEAETGQVIQSFQAELRDRLEAIDYSMIGFQSRRLNIDAQQILMPTIDLDSVKRIDAEV